MELMCLNIFLSLRVQSSIYKIKIGSARYTYQQLLEREYLVLNELNKDVFELP